MYMMTPFRFAAVALAATLLAGAAHAVTIKTVTIDTVPVGNAGNIADTRYPTPRVASFGSVGYDYNIGKYEVTASQYTAFLNAVAKTDTYDLYNENMNGVYGSGITRTGNPNDYSYDFSDLPDGTTEADWRNRPVNYISWGDAARFANWLHNGQPTGMQGSLTTEDGAYAINGATTNAEWMAITRKNDAMWFLPTEDEWYKAAYHKGGGTDAGYWDYPTGSNGEPRNDIRTPDGGNNANFQDNDYTVGSPYGTTEVGEFENSSSPYGTFDQGGNLWEWNETAIDPYRRGVRGGYWNYYSHYMAAWTRLDGLAPPRDDDRYAGFRVASVPDPVQPSTVVGRHTFYNHSAFDGADMGANAADDAAIATDKSALAPGEPASFDNYTNFDGGINGIVVDIDRPSVSGAMNIADSRFRVGNNDDPETWESAPLHSGGTFRSSEGVDGSDRVMIVWPDGAIVNQWLEVTVLANDRTGLEADEVFYFGNAVGDVGNSAFHATVNDADFNAVSANYTDAADVENVFDVNRDGQVDPNDAVIVRTNYTTDESAMTMLWGPQPSTVVGRHTFYNNSDLDGNDPAANAADDAAIATDKTALSPGEPATFENYTNFENGINGIIIDVDRPSVAASMHISDFGFRVGNNDAPSTWELAPGRSGASLRSGEGLGSSDRVMIVWPDGAIVNQWLEVTVKANDRTGLEADEVFYFGNSTDGTMAMLWTSVPEPSTFVLALSGLLACGTARRRRRADRRVAYTTNLEDR